MIVLRVAHLFGFLFHLTLFLLLMDEKWHSVDCQKMEGLEEGIEDGVIDGVVEAEAAATVSLIAA